MSGSQNNINDLLLGLGAPMAATNSGTKGISAGDTTGADFAALLGVLSGIGINGGSLQANSVLNLQANPNSTTQPSTADAELFASQMASLLDGKSNLIGILSESPVTSLLSSGSIKSGEGTVAANLGSQNILQALSKGQLSGINAGASQIPDGKYKVVSAAISDGKLDLQLVNKDDAKSEIHLSIPVELLQKQGSTQVNPLQPLVQRSLVADAVSLLSKPSSVQSVTELFSQLNVTDVSISKASLATAQTGQPMTAISFSDSMASEAPLLTSLIPTAQLKSMASASPSTEGTSDSGASETADNANTHAGKSVGSTVSFVQNDPLRPAVQTPSTPQSDAQPLFRTAAVRINSKVLTQDSSAIGKLLGDSEKSDANLFKMDLNDSTLRGSNLSRPIAAGSAKLEQPAVRITLPENLSSLLDGHGRSINIKLEPEFLGPARLNLSMRGESLTAKLTVETTQAKAAVENSITQLTDQLAKVGIKVDYFDVSMRGGGAGQESFQRPQDWFMPNRPRVRNFDDDGSLDSITKTETPTLLRETTYLNRLGVNLYA